MGARSGGGVRGGSGRSMAAFKKKVAAFQSKYDAARKTYNQIKKGLPKGGPISQSYAATKIMNQSGMQTPSQIKDDMNRFIQSHWGFTSF